MSDEVKRLVDEGRTASEICAILGVAPVSLRNILKEHNLRPSRVKSFRTYGLSDDSIQFRAKLAGLLNDMKTTMTYAEIAKATGLNTWQQKAATTRPYDYDWTLSQIERTLNYNGQSFTA